MVKKIILLLIINLSFHNVHAWSLKTHLYIAQQVLNDVLDDGMVTLAGKKYAVPEKIYIALKAHPDKFRMGCLGPDVFPDFVVGQMTTHPGINEEDGWRTDKWLKHLLKHAKKPEDLAFCYGYVVHASSDIFAHTYVNMFAGDVFSLLDKERTVELRHFVLEKFIEKYTPAIKDNLGNLVDLRNSLSSPSAFLASTLILNEDVFKQHSLKDAKTPSLHLISMYKVQQKVSGLKSSIDRLNQFLENFRFGRKAELNGLITRRDDYKTKGVEKRYEIVAMENKEMNAGVYATENLEYIVKERKAFADLIENAKQVEKEIATAEEEINESTSMSGIISRIQQFLNDWDEGIQQAANLYINASDSAGIMLLNGKGNPMKCYTDWAKCHGWAFVAVPDVIPATWCNFQDYLKLVQEEMLKMEAFKLIKRFIDLMTDIKKHLLDKLKPTLLKATEYLVADVFKQDKESVELAYYMRFADEITKEKLDEIYRKDSSGKNLLKYDEVSKFVFEDMKLDNAGYFDKKEFGPVANSITMSTLALLDPKALNELINDNAGTTNSVLYGDPVYPAYNGHFTILFDAVTSIDGNHQWQPYPLPYPREKYDIQQNSFGYNYYENPSQKMGFKLWADTTLRSKVFLKLFNKSSMGSLAQKLRADKYPFPECEINLYPSTTNSQGRKVSMDSTCVKK